MEERPVEAVIDDWRKAGYIEVIEPVGRAIGAPPKDRAMKAPARKKGPKATRKRTK